MTSTHGLHRRTVLAGALAGTAALAAPALEPTTAVAAAPPSPRSRGISALRARPGSRLVQAADGSSVQMPAVLGAEVTVGQAGVGPGATLTLTYDRRLYVAAPRAFILSDGRLIPVTSRPGDDGPLTQRVEILLPMLTAGTYMVHAGGLAPDRFPADLTTTPQPLQVKVSEPGGAITAQVLSTSARKGALPWGAQLGAGWTQLTWDTRYYAWHPATVTLLSVGPGAIPAGCRLRVSLDQRVFGSVAVLAAADPLGRRVVGVARRSTNTSGPVATWTASAPVPAGERITLTYRTVGRSVLGRLADLEAPLVEFLPPKEDRAAQRLTSHESLTRMDSVFSPETLARYGPTG